MLRSAHCLPQGSTSTWVETILTNAGSFPDRDMVTVEQLALQPVLRAAAISAMTTNGHSNAPFVLYSLRRLQQLDTQCPSSRRESNNRGECGHRDQTARYTRRGKTTAGKRSGWPKSADGGATFGTAHVGDELPPEHNRIFRFHSRPQNTRGILPFPMTAVRTGRNPPRPVV